MGLLVNIDNGGTFTDVCIRDDRRVIHAKSPTTPHDLTQCFVDGLRRVSGALYGEEDLARLLRECDYLRYSTTAGTNAVVERTGVAAALIVEEGEEADVYGTRGEIEDDDLWRALVLGEPVGLTIGTDGGVDPAQLTAQVNRVLSNGAQRLVIALRAEATERAVKALLLDKYPRHLLGAVPFLVSHELVSDTDPARRTVTALLNSYLHPGMEHFLYGAERACKANSLHRPLLIYRNDGDSARVAKTTAIKTWGSGPRGGLEGAIAYARFFNAPAVVAMDVGGTTTDIAVVTDGRVRRNTFGEVEGARISFPLPDMRSHGLGGSSVIRVVGDGTIKVGPESVGAAPGPACFGRGGTDATLTDALLLAGVIDGANFLGGEVALDAERAANAIANAVAGPLSLSVDGAVEAIVDAFAHKVGARVRHAVENAGREPAEATLLAFGGGGPMIATAIAKAAGIARVIVPHMAAVFSAYGIGFSNLAHEYRAHDIDMADLPKIKDGLRARGRRDMFGEGVDADQCHYLFGAERDLDGALVERSLNGSSAPATMEHDRLEAGETLRLRVVHELPKFAMTGEAALAVEPLREHRHAKVALKAGERVDVPVFSNDALVPGHRVAGPALIRGAYLTCLIGPKWRLQVTPNHDLVLETVQ